jgi:hypothetical protein
MELFLENQKLDVTSLRFDNFYDIVLVKDGEEKRYTSDTGWDVDDGFELKVTKRLN